MIFAIISVIMVKIYIYQYAKKGVKMKKITVVTGHYGSGKTNLSVNIALKSAAEGKKVAVCDLDIVNPYFRLADFEDIFREKGIEFAAPQFANTSLDIPALNFNVEGLADFSDHLIIDVGGDDAGAVALGRYSETLHNLDSEFEMIYVINKYRYLEGAEDETALLIPQIEAASRMKHTGIVNNSNLGEETTEDIVKNSVEYAESISERTGLPLLYTTYPSYLERPFPKAVPVDVYVKPVWER